MFKISRNKICFLGIICAFIMCISGIYAFVNLTVVSVKNDLNTGAVNIKLEEYTINKEGKEVLYEDTNEIYFPGQTVSFMPRISNLGDSCYIRAKFNYTDVNNVLISADNNIEIQSEDWVKQGDYWYYKKVLNTNENVNLFKTIKLPTDLSNKYQDKTICLNIIAEAVQSKNFEPKFESQLPWDDVIAKKAIDDIYKTDKIQSNSNVKIDYENNADNYIDVPDNFFGKLNYLMPGDVITEEISINNKSASNVEYFISTNKIDDNTEKALQLLEKLKLSIEIDKKIIYEGSIHKLDKFSLGKFDSNSSSKVTFIVNVPKDLENEYSALNANVNWTFSIVEEKKEEPKEEIESPQTGDIKFTIVFTIFLVSAVGLILSIVFERRVKRKSKIKTTDKEKVGGKNE